jgi:hypothetical protein
MRFLGAVAGYRKIDGKEAWTLDMNSIYLT